MTYQIDRCNDEGLQHDVDDVVAMLGLKCSKKCEIIYRLISSLYLNLVLVFIILVQNYCDINFFSLSK